MTLLIVVPARNESAQLEQTLRRLLEDAARVFSAHDWRVVVAENGSTDATPDIADAIARTSTRLQVLRCTRTGKGGAIREAWDAGTADVLAFLDADLAADAEALARVVAALDASDLAVGSRRLPDSQTSRSPKRRAVSAGFNALARALLRLPVADAQCGCKAIRSEAWKRVSPSLRHDDFLFDTELIAHAHRRGMRIEEVPIAWSESSRVGSGSVRLMRDSWRMFAGLLGLRGRLR